MVRVSISKHVDDQKGHKGHTLEMAENLFAPITAASTKLLFLRKLHIPFNIRKLY